MGATHVRLTRSAPFVAAMGRYYGLEPRSVGVDELERVLTLAFAHGIQLRGEDVARAMEGVDLGAVQRGRFLNLSPANHLHIRNLEDHWGVTLGAGPRPVLSTRFIVIAALYLLFIAPRDAST